MLVFDGYRNGAASQENLFSGFPKMPDTKRGVQSQKLARGYTIPNQKVEGLFYLCIENKGANQLCGYCTNLHICFRIFEK